MVRSAIRVPTDGLVPSEVWRSGSEHCDFLGHWWRRGGSPWPPRSSPYRTAIPDGVIPLHRLPKGGEGGDGSARAATGSRPYATAPEMPAHTRNPLACREAIGFGRCLCSGEATIGKVE